MSDIIEELDKHLEAADPAQEPETPPEEEAPEETAEEEAPAEETAEPEAEEEAPVARDERLTAYLDKYGGDVDKALTAAVEAQELLGRQGSELGDLRKEIQALSERIPEQDDDQYVPMDDSTMNWFDQAMEENPVQAMEWARQNDPTGTYYNRGLQAWMDLSPAQAVTYQQAVIAKQLREEFKAELGQHTKPLQAQADQQTVAAAWAKAKQDIPDLEQHAEAILAEAKETPEILRGADTLEQKVVALHKLYRLVKGSAATSLETARETAETEQKAQNRAAKLSGTTPATKAVAPEPEVDENEQWARDFLDPYLPEPEAA